MRPVCAESATEDAASPPASVGPSAPAPHTKPRKTAPAKPHRKRRVNVEWDDGHTYTAVVVKEEPDRILVHYEGWTREWDEWFPRAAPNIHSYRASHEDIYTKPYLELRRGREAVAPVPPPGDHDGVTPRAHAEAASAPTAGAASAEQSPRALEEGEGGAHGGPVGTEGEFADVFTAAPTLQVPDSFAVLAV